jgi:uncharacterized protein (DUF488 family)
MSNEQLHIWTIGHSTRTEDEFLEILASFGIQALVDIRTLPGSRKFPHFNKEHLDRKLQQAGIAYFHFAELGGRRKPKEDSQNTAWRHPSFRGYADYMETNEFRGGIEKLELLAKTRRVAYMCSEAVWWKCHRSLVSDYLKTKGWIVNHITGVGKSTMHPYTSPARVEQGKLFYS